MLTAPLPRTQTTMGWGHCCIILCHCWKSFQVGLQCIIKQHLLLLYHQNSVITGLLLTVINMCDCVCKLSRCVFCTKTVTSDMMDKIHKELQCPICWNRLVQPKLLPCCQHTFCLKCIGSYFQRCTNGQALCPVCRASFQLPRRGAAALENNNIASRLLDITKAN